MSSDRLVRRREGKPHFSADGNMTLIYRSNSPDSTYSMHLSNKRALGVFAHKFLCMHAPLCSEAEIHKGRRQNSHSLSLWKIVNHDIDFWHASKQLLCVYERPQWLFVTPTPGFSKSSEAYLSACM